MPPRADGRENGGGVPAWKPCLSNDCRETEIEIEIDKERERERLNAEYYGVGRKSCTGETNKGEKRRASIVSNAQSHHATGAG